MASHELFIYWRTASAQATRAIAAAQAWQADLRARYAGLAATLYSRVDPTGMTVTVMEVYAAEARPAATPVAALVDASFEQLVDREGREVLGPWLAGTRHVEVFQRCPPQAPQPGERA
ncbi:MAG: DUF4936 family protein [Rubrivivax sp.]|nr:DUF4936 family protein [Rubrivivax sp.]